MTATKTRSATKNVPEMDQLLLIFGPPSAPLLAGQDDAMFALPAPFAADGYDAAWPCGDAQVFDDWVAAPPPTAAASPAVELLTSPPALSPTVGSPCSSRASAQGSPLLASDFALSLVGTLQPAVVDYAALLPSFAAALPAALASPTEPCLPFSQSPSALDLAGMARAAGPASPAASAESDAAGSDEQRKRRDREFLASLPPQLALKRRRTSNTRQKDKILAELLQPADEPVAPQQPQPQPQPQPPLRAASAESEPAEGEPLDAAALKRKKNTDAARRSRMRKILRIETLESRVSELEGENARLAQLVARLEAEKAAMARIH
ncbi:hypothetical protein H4R18_004204 [Coemansia javaensis]|uniref:BZIP domain-containing protein n=1 Tax=Coemansia javaensis TaxID=2761396 RepID=A0A9W8H4X2_9FUNG|nr:hypothetical protein H4R18_004204 [Coemansia javaensis]